MVFSQKNFVLLQFTTFFCLLPEPNIHTGLYTTIHNITFEKQFNDIIPIKDNLSVSYKIFNHLLTRKKKKLNSFSLQLISLQLIMIFSGENTDFIVYIAVTHLKINH